MNNIFNYIIFLLVYCISFYSANNTHAQNPYSINFRINNKLSSNKVYDISQDRQGYIWLVTNNGLTRFDGTTIKEFTSDKLTSLAGASLRHDAFGRIWYENFDGYYYYLQNDTFHQIDQSKPIGYQPIAMTDKYIFIPSKDGFDIFNHSNVKKVKTIQYNVDDIESFRADNDRLYLILKGKILTIDNEFNVKHIDTNSYNRVNDNILFVNNDYLFYCDKYNNDKTITVFDKSFNKNYKLIFEAGSNTFIQYINSFNDLLYIATTNGIFIYKKINDKFIFQNTIFKDANVSKIIIDDLNNIWIATLNNGIYLIPDLNTQIYKLYNEQPISIIPLNNELIISNATGDLLAFSNEFEFRYTLYNSHSNAPTKILSIDNYNNQLLLNDKLFKVKRINNSNVKSYNIAIKKITIIDQYFYLYAASNYCGIAPFDPKNPNNITSKWYNIYESSQPISRQNNFLRKFFDNVRGKSVSKDLKNKKSFFATNNGIYQVDSNLNVIELTHNENSIHATDIYFNNNYIYLIDNKGNIKQYELINNRLHIVKNLFKDLQFYKLDCNGYYYLCNTNEIAIFNARNNSFIDVPINIDNKKINDIQLNDSIIYIATNDGVIATSLPNDSTITSPQPRFYINEIIAGGKTHNTLNNIILNYNDNDVIIKFSIISFGINNNADIYYRLNDEEWKELSSDSRMVEFASLKPEDYTIQFKIGNKIYDQKVLFTIKPPLWGNIYFIMTIITIIIIIIYIIFKNEWKKLNEKNNLLNDKNKLLIDQMQLKEDLNKSILTAIKSQMNPHFFYNALNTIQAYIFTNEKEKANNYLSKFSRLTRIILEQTALEYITLADEIESIQLYLDLEKIRFNNQFVYNITLNLIQSKDDIYIPPMIIQPFVENSIKHGLLHKNEDRRLTLEIIENDHYLYIIIDDNGIGRDKSAQINKNIQHKSFATEATNKRIDILNKLFENKYKINFYDKYDENNHPSGTQVIIKVPIHNQINN